MIFFWNMQIKKDACVCVRVFRHYSLYCTRVVFDLIWFDFWSIILWFYRNLTGCCFMLIFIFLVSRLFRNTFIYSTVNKIWTELNMNWIWIEYDLNIIWIWIVGLLRYGTVRVQSLAIISKIYLSLLVFFFFLLFLLINPLIKVKSR